MNPFIVRVFSKNIKRKIMQTVHMLITIFAAFLGVFFAAYWERLGMSDIHPILPIIIASAMLGVLIVIAWCLDSGDKNERKGKAK